MTTVDSAGLGLVLENAARDAEANLYQTRYQSMHVRDRLAQLYRQVGRTAEAEKIESDYGNTSLRRPTTIRSRGGCVGGRSVSCETYHDLQSRR